VIGEQSGHRVDVEDVALDRARIGEVSVEGKRVPAAALDVINTAAARAPASPALVEPTNGVLHAELRHHTADATDVVLATFAADAVEVLTGPGREHLRACGAPGCVLLFSKEHPRRTWCSVACGNRARQARHYERVRKTRSRHDDV
jgi:predicted RNA-binding Zn ribbon-like protein